MSKYSKFHSTYILRKKHQNTNIGEIYERDWTTLSERHSIEKDKTPIYSDGNFLFTVNNTDFNKRKYSINNWDYENIAYNDVKDSKNNWNQPILNWYSNDLRDFCYYGSCTELIRASIENIINNFPCDLHSTDYLIYTSSDEEDLLDEETVNSKGQYEISNPFNIDLMHTDFILNDNDNEMRYLGISFDKYQINNRDIISYRVNHTNDFECNNNKRIAIVYLTDSDNEEITINIYKSNNTYIYCSNYSLDIEPKTWVFEKYFDGLNDFEKILLNRNSNPYYSCDLITPIKTENNINYVIKSYTWPSDGQYIDINSKAYNKYVNDLIELSAIFDEIWCDNIYRSMTHEAIKNFDWTFTKDYNYDDEVDNMDGGNRVVNLLRIYGRCFDDIKRYIDGIKFTNIITYDNINNICDSDLTEKLELNGWSVQNIDDDFDKEARLINIKWFDSLNEEYMTPYYTNSSFIKRLLLNSKFILKNKGKTSSIEMIMALFGLGKGIDYDIIEHSYIVEPIDYDNNISVIEKLNNNIKKQRYDDDVFSGLTLSDTFINKKHVIVPYQDRNKKYYNGIYFQSKGGWGYDNKQYMETIPYLNVVSDINELCQVNPNSVNLYDIYYVNDISDYENDGSTSPSNFFYINDLNTNDIISWINIDNNWKFINNPSNKEDILHKNLYIKSKYLESIVYSKFGNNPHVGYGNYDNGLSYHINMKEPFKYICDNNLFYDLSNCDIAKTINFDSYFPNVGYTEGYYLKTNNSNISTLEKDCKWSCSGYIEVSDYTDYQIVIHNGLQPNEIFNNICADCYDINFVKIKSIPYSNNIIKIPITDGIKYVRISFINKGNVYINNSNGSIIWKPINNLNKTHIISKDENYYFINDKNLDIINYHRESVDYIKFFRKIILPYIMQVIPSSTILNIYGF